MKNFYQITFCLLLFLIACKDSTKEAKPKVQESQKTEVKGIKLPGLPFDIRNKLMKEATAVDYSWNNLPLSMSMGIEDGLRQNISFISTEIPDVIPAYCRPVAHKYFSVGGDVYLDADVYLTEGCFFYVFVDGSKPIYANMITAEGINFYNQVLSRSVPKPTPK